MNSYDWYQKLIRPDWAPPAWLFGPVWTVLYLVIAVSFGIVVFKIANKQLPSIILWPLILNLLFNFMFTPIQFGLRNNFLAMIDIGLVLCTLIWLLKLLMVYFPIAALVNIPYLLWVMFATVLQVTVTWLNR